jgi:hypothetical protein
MRGISTTDLEESMMFDRQNLFHPGAFGTQIAFGFAGD